MRSIASPGNHFEHRRPSRSLRLAPPRDIPVARQRWVSAPISPETLGCLSVSPRLGYRVVRALDRSQMTWLRVVRSSNPSNRQDYIGSPKVMLTINTAIPSQARIIAQPQMIPHQA